MITILDDGTVLPEGWLHCNQCGHDWKPRKPVEEKKMKYSRCPSCQSRHWQSKMKIPNSVPHDCPRCGRTWFSRTKHIIDICPIHRGGH